MDFFCLVDINVFFDNELFLVWVFFLKKKNRSLYKMSLIFFLSSICLFDLKLLSTLVKMRIFIGKEDEEEEERRMEHSHCL
jgi:hypothetical protein